jgi:hypothetical protein
MEGDNKRGEKNHMTNPTMAPLTPKPTAMSSAKPKAFYFNWYCTRPTPGDTCVTDTDQHTIGLLGINWGWQKLYVNYCYSGGRITSNDVYARRRLPRLPERRAVD